MAMLLQDQLDKSLQPSDMHAYRRQAKARLVYFLTLQVAPPTQDRLKTEEHATHQRTIMNMKCAG